MPETKPGGVSNLITPTSAVDMVSCLCKQPHLKEEALHWRAAAQLYTFKFHAHSLFTYFLLLNLPIIFIYSLFYIFCPTTTELFGHLKAAEINCVVLFTHLRVTEEHYHHLESFLWPADVYNVHFH